MSAVALELEREELAPGEWVAGAVVVQHAASARALEVSIAFCERTSDLTERHLVATTGPMPVSGRLEAGWRFPFRLQLPPQVLPPYATPWGELFWEVDAKVDVPQALDGHARRRILVLPPGVERAQLGSAERERERPAGIVLAAQVAGRAAGVVEADPLQTPGADAAPGSFAAGWYADPWLEKRLRWWDGNAWTGATAD